MAQPGMTLCTQCNIGGVAAASSHAYRTNFIAELSGLVIVRRRDCGHLDVAQPPNSLGMDTAHESCAEYRGFELLHCEFSPSAQP